MPSTYSTNLRIELVADNEQSGIWGQTTNRNFTQVFEETITATAEVDVTAGDVTLTAVNGATDQARRPFIRVIGSPVVARQVNVPDVTKLYFVQNTTGQNVTIKPTGQTGVTLLMGQFGYVRTRTGLSAQLIELLATVSGNLTVPGTLTVGGATTLSTTLAVTGAVTLNSTLAVTGATTHTGAITVTMPNAEAINIRSGNAANYVVYTAGRTATEAIWGISGGANNVVLGDVAGDFGLRNSSGRLLFAPNGISASIFMNASGLGVGINPTTPLHAVLTESTGYSAANMLAASSTVLSARNLSTTNNTYAAIRLEATGAGSNATAAIATVWTADGASALAFGTRLNAAGSVVEGARLTNSGDWGVGYTPPNYGAAIRVIGVNAVTQAIFDLSMSGTRQATFTVDGSTALVGTLVNKPLSLYTNGAARINIIGSGLVGIARTPVTHVFEVAGTTALGHTTADMLRLTHDTAFLSFYNTAASTRSGYIQLTSAGVMKIDTEVGGAGAIINLAVNGTNRLSVNNSGHVNLLAGYGSLRFNGAISWAESSGALAINASFALGSLPRRPDTLRVFLVCVTAEAGYVAGQTVEWPSSRVGYTGGWWAYTNAASDTTTVQTLNATVQIPSTGGVATNLTPANWTLMFRVLFL